MLTIDGAEGEGGGQILRTSLGLSLLSGAPFRLINIRAARKKPGLQRQHLTAVRAACEVGRAEVSGDEIHSRELTFRPGSLQSGQFRFDIGTAGSATLVLQTVLPALMAAGEDSTIELHGGTHNPLAPPVDFLEHSFAPLLARLGPRLSIAIDRYGFYPAGGGKMRVSIHPARRLAPLDLIERGQGCDPVSPRKTRVFWAWDGEVAG